MAERELSPMENFVLPEKTMSLKIIFDNIRNYVIIGALVGLAIWLDSSKAKVPPIFSNNSAPERANWWLCLMLAAILFCLNGSQTYFIITRVVRSYLQSKAGRFVNPSKLGGRSRISKVLVTFAALAVTAAVTVVIVRLILLALYVAWFTAARGGA